jgi:hypothetical protein
LITHRTVGVDQKAISWIDPSASLIRLLCDPGCINSFLLVTNEPTAKTKEKTNLNLLRGRLRGRAGRFDVLYELISTRQDRLEVVFGHPLMVRSEHKDSLRCANKLLDGETQCTVHTSILEATRDQDSVSKEPVCRSIVVSGRRLPSDSQHSGLSPSMSAMRSFSFSYGIVVLLRQALELLVQEDEWISSHGLAEPLLRIAVLRRNHSSAS